MIISSTTVTMRVGEKCMWILIFGRKNMLAHLTWYTWMLSRSKSNLTTIIRKGKSRKLKTMMNSRQWVKGSNKLYCRQPLFEWQQWHYRTLWWPKIRCIHFERFWLCKSPNFIWESDRHKASAKVIILFGEIRFVLVATSKFFKSFAVRI